MSQTIWSLENEREARGQEATEASQRHAQALEEVKLRDMAAADLQKKVRQPIRRKAANSPPAGLRDSRFCSDLLQQCNQACVKMVQRAAH